MILVPQRNLVVVEMKVLDHAGIKRTLDPLHGTYIFKNGVTQLNHCVFLAKSLRAIFRCWIVPLQVVLCSVRGQRPHLMNEIHALRNNDEKIREDYVYVDRPVG